MFNWLLASSDDSFGVQLTPSCGVGYRKTVDALLLAALSAWLNPPAERQAHLAAADCGWLHVSRLLCDRLPGPKGTGRDPVQAHCLAWVEFPRLTWHQELPSAPQLT